jgi:hypothetical protein
MATSQNGYTVRTTSAGLDRSEVAGVTFPNGLRDDDTGYVLRYVAEQLHARVEKARAGWCWGWAYRPIRGQSTGFSNHASATAFDYNAPSHPMGKANTFTSAQRAEIRKILAEVDGVVRWGATYENRPDDMHFEIDAPYAEVQQVAAKLRKPKPKPPVDTTSEYGEWSKAAAGDRTLSKGDAGEDVRKLQFILNRWYDNLSLTEDGYFGAGTDAAVRYMQGRAGLTVDGVVGERTWSALNVN